MSLPLADDEEKGKRFSCGCPEYISPSRNYGIDALRIVAMMMVLILHLLASIDVLSLENHGSASYNVGWQSPAATRHYRKRAQGFTIYFFIFLFIFL